MMIWNTKQMPRNTFENFAVKTQEVVDKFIWNDCRCRLSPFNRPFSRWIWVSRCLLKQRMMEVVVTTGAINRAKLQSNHHHQHFYRPNALPVAQPKVSKQWREKISHSMDLLTPSSPGVFQLCLWPLIAAGYLEGGLSCLSSALWCQ